MKTSLIVFLVLSILVVGCGQSSDTSNLSNTIACSQTFPACGGAVTRDCLQTGPAETVNYTFVNFFESGTANCTVTATHPVTCTIFHSFTVTLTDGGGNPNVLNIDQGKNCHPG